MERLLRKTFRAPLIQHLIALVAGLAPLIADVAADVSASLRRALNVRLWRAELRALRIEDRGRAPARRATEAELAYRRLEQRVEWGLLRTDLRPDTSARVA